MNRANIIASIVSGDLLSDFDLLMEDEAEEVIQRVIDALDWQGEVHSISAFNREGTNELTQKIMTFIEELPEETVEEEPPTEDVEFKWDTYHEETIAGFGDLSDDLDDEDWDEDDYDVEVEYRK